MLYQINKASLSIGGEQILNRIDFEIKDKEKIALVGKNGAGKTSLLKLIAGQLDPDRDDRAFQSPIYMAENVTIEMLSQTPDYDGKRTVRDEIRDYAKDSRDDDPYSKERYEREQEYLRMFTGLGFTMGDCDRYLHEFSGGQQTRIALIRLLLKKPHILLLDEPTNHLDLSAVRWLEGYIRTYPGAIVIVSHDRYFLDQTVDIVYEIEEGLLRRYPGNYSAYRKEKKARNQREMKRYKAQEEEIERLQSLISRFKGRPNKAAMARAKKKQLDRMEKIDKPREEEGYHFDEEITPNKRGSKQALYAKDLSVGYPGSDPLFTVSFSLRRGRKLGLIGMNGSGKTSLLETIAGNLPALSGELRTGSGIETAYYRQDAGEKDLSLSLPKDRSPVPSVLDYFRYHFPEYTEKELRTKLARYMFRGAEASRPLSGLSGGEKGRLILAVILESRPNLLLLDEPTNHMDIPAKETIESALHSYKGTVVLVTHDRYLLSRIADSLLIIDEGRVWYYPFDYEHYQRMLRKKEEGITSGVSAVEAENTLLVESLHAVPGKERHQSARFSTDQSYTDWQLALAGEEVRNNKETIEKILSAPAGDADMTAEEYYSWIEDKKKDLDRYMDIYTESCLNWYDMWQQYEEAFAGYRD